MANRQKKIDTLETAALECELISQLALGKNVRRLNNQLSAKYLKVANDLKHPGLIATEERIAAGRKLVARQRGIVARLESQGHPTKSGRQLLLVLEETLEILEKQRDVYRQLR